MDDPRLPDESPFAYWARIALRFHYKIAEMAKKYRCTPEHFAKCFKADFGVPIKRTLEEFRIEKAREAVGASERIKEIADILGFRDSSHLCHAFKRQYGVSPLRYRKRVRKAGRSTRRGRGRPGAGP